MVILWTDMAFFFLNGLKKDVEMLGFGQNNHILNDKSSRGLSFLRQQHLSSHKNKKDFYEE